MKKILDACKKLCLLVGAISLLVVTPTDVQAGSDTEKHEISKGEVFTFECDTRTDKTFYYTFQDSTPVKFKVVLGCDKFEEHTPTYSVNCSMGNAQGGAGVYYDKNEGAYYTRTYSFEKDTVLSLNVHNYWYSSNVTYPVSVAVVEDLEHANNYELECNDSKTDANKIGNEVYGYSKDWNDDYFVYVAKDNGYITPEIEIVNNLVQADDSTYVSMSFGYLGLTYNFTADDSNNRKACLPTYFVEKGGKYYISVHGGYAGYSYDYYKISMNFKKADGESGKNMSKKKADTLKKSKAGYLSKASETDWYVYKATKGTEKKKAKTTFTFEVLGKDLNNDATYDIAIMNKSGKVVKKISEFSSKKTVSINTVKNEQYYIKLKKHDYPSYKRISEYCAPYKVTVK